MKWEGQRRSDNVEDRRGGGPPGLGGGRRGGGRGLGLGSIVIAVIAAWIFGINPMTVLGLLGGVDTGAPVAQGPAAPPPAADREAAFVSTVLADTEDVWHALFRSGNSRYREPKLVLFRGAVPTACGTGQSAMGPFYCPLDSKVYIDLSFYDELQSRFGAPGDFAQAYVVAHEIGHHVQHLLGTLDTVQRAKQGIPQAQANALQVRVELQADCYAGVWAHHADRSRGVVEPGDIEEALNAAAAIGDDRLQRQARGTVSPESFTHGTSEQRARWFRRGFDQGSLNACDTFNAQQL